MSAGSSGVSTDPLGLLSSLATGRRPFCRLLAHRTELGHVLDRHDHLEVPLLRGPRRDHLDRAGTAEEARDLLDRPDRGREADAERRAIGNGLEPLEREGEVRTAAGFEDGVDLNRVMPGKPNGNESALYAHRFLDRVVSQLDYLVDLHTASSGRENSLYVRVDTSDQRALTVARVLSPQIILHSPGADGTLRGAAQRRGDGDLEAAGRLEDERPQLGLEGRLGCPAAEAGRCHN